jgi:hypothetical protein
MLPRQLAAMRMASSTSTATSRETPGSFMVTPSNWSAQFHGGLVVRDEYELHAARHLAHDFAEAADVVLVEWRVHLVEQAERRRVQFENREHERHRGERFLAARQLADGAVPLARRSRHDRDAGLEHVVADEFKVGVAAAEQPRELLLEAGVDAVEGVLETAARLAVDLSHGILERRERVVESANCRSVFLAFGLFAELVDRRQVDLAQALDLLPVSADAAPRT